MADWIVRSRDNQGMPYLVIDKTDARVYVFQADGQLRAAASALLGMAVGDESAPDIGQRQLSRIRPDERTTPAGRFVASLGRNLQGGQILWVDYESALSLHPVVTNNPKRCCQLITKLLHLLTQGETFTSSEVTDVFFGVTKLFQSKDHNLRRMM